MLGKMFISAVLAEGSVAGLLQFGDIESLFKASEVPVYAFVREFVKKYQALPSPDTILAHVDEALVPHKEPAAYYYDLLVLRDTEHRLKKAMQDATQNLLPNNKQPEKALVTLSTAVMELVSRRQAKQVVDFREAHDALIADYVAKWKTPDQYGIQFGWPTLDDIMGGAVKGDMISIIGRPAVGKTWQLLYGALHGWRQGMKLKDPTPAEIQNQTPLFVSMEMNPLAIQQRLAAMFTHLPAGQIKHAGLTSSNLQKYKDGLTLIKGHHAPFWVVDGNLTATVEDIFMLAQYLKPGSIWIDGGYLLKHPKVSDRYQRVAENADLIKQELAPLAPTTVSWQFARSAAKKDKKKGEKAGLEDIGYSDAIAQVSSVALGVFQDESVETLLQRVIDILKGRNGEVGKFTTNWDFIGMDFSEVLSPHVEDLQFL
ncbi:MAG: DnaB helicase C-terminal domain-containing protein [Aquamicrobium sp.]|uniref:DnaB-like helicase C-terminal domain-containing protein n=1 Tax=Aquamicrobium sp. TaxID=1872579 RepID=UPI00349E6C8A|nr:DnaB helicase C-terminal domain-containing protein [Aquamicrobium sp.]